MLHLLITVFAKVDQENLSKSERNEIKKMISFLEHGLNKRSVIINGKDV